MKKLIVLIALSFLSLSAMADCEVQENARTALLVEAHRQADPRTALHVEDHRQAAEPIRRHLNPFDRYRVQRELSNAMRELSNAMEEQLRAHRQIEICAEDVDTDKRRQVPRR